MKLSFDSQFSLAPLLVVLLLAGLVIYTVLELNNIQRENDITVKWELLTDRIQVSIANISLTDKLVKELIDTPLVSDDERLFPYLEQTRILADSLHDPVFAGDVPEHLRAAMQTTGDALNEPELIAPKIIHLSLSELLPKLQYQYKLYMAQRRSAFMDYHTNLNIIIPRLSGALLTVLVVCIVLAISLTFWGLALVRKRITLLTQYAQDITNGKLNILSEPEYIKDELDMLELTLSRASKQLINVFAVDKILQGTEKERHRIAMDIHDGVLADLTALTRKIDSLKNNLIENEQKELRDATDDITQSLRDIVDDLHPQTLHILGLEAALRSMLERQFRVAKKITHHFDFDASLEAQLQVEHKINIFRIISEAVHNVQRHANCNQVEISCRVLSTQLVVTVEDNGIGMPKQVENLNHGCTNILERARTIGAEVLWRPSRFASGTCVELKLALGIS